MHRFWFSLYYPILIMLSLLPMKVLYALSDLLYIILYKIFGYRKKVVRKNLNNAFPEKTDKEKFKIEAGFYHHLCDIIVESVKSFRISKKEIIQRINMENLPKNFIANDLGKDQSVFFLLGHIGNWEWGAYISSVHFNAKTHIVYHSLSNQPFDELMQKTRSKFGAILSNMNQVTRTLVSIRNEISITCLVADQSPNPNGAYWTNFLNQKTAFFRGPAKLAIKFGYPVYYIYCEKTSRGFYKINKELLVKNPKEHSEDEILELYAKVLEKEIKQYPHLWLWSHKRWKHKYIH